MNLGITSKPVITQLELVFTVNPFILWLAFRSLSSINMFSVFLCLCKEYSQSSYSLRILRWKDLELFENNSRSFLLNFFMVFCTVFFFDFDSFEASWKINLWFLNLKGICLHSFYLSIYQCFENICLI